MLAKSDNGFFANQRRSELPFLLKIQDEIIGVWLQNHHANYVNCIIQIHY